ncbi:hypothetical protein [Methylobacterium sp. AMS5]|uniref:hypothetical protein n=1 Tax=Methylobacterium sp. AMS5 TaxID=925818 RepID=UPI00074FA8BA|nr:hypothetical protein [Methylobacterium sp. AMS5]AMB48312.1 hypothetical protein Y590_25425 [Methylobacterium sp. AMS5]
METYWLTLGGVLGALAGAVITFAAAHVIHDRDRRHARRFRSVADLALHQSEVMQNTRGTRGPNGQDWCDLYDELQPHERD